MKKGSKIHEQEPTDSAWVPPVESWHRPGQVSVTVVEGPGKGQAFTLRAGQTSVVGRSPAADIVLAHPSVSGAHCQFRLEKDTVEIRDLKSTNGTWIGPIGVERVTVGPGTQIIVGDYTLALGPIEEVEVPIWGANYLGEMLGCSRVMREVFAHIVKVAKTPLGVLITGETGTGKELAARAIHGASDRASDGPWVVFDCAAQAPSLIEAALFGYERGAFTGADTSQVGLVESASGGSLFIDEVGELPLQLQLRLLRVLDRQEITPIGGTTPRKVDVRIVAATNRNLANEVANGRFREDLYFRLARSRVELPPLRRREGDPVFIGEHVLASVVKRRGDGVELRFSEEARRTLATRYWKGNVRELRNVVESEAFLADGPEVDLRSASPRTSELRLDDVSRLAYDAAHVEFDRLYLSMAMERAGGRLRAASRMLDIGRPRLRRKLLHAGLTVVDDDS